MEIEELFCKRYPEYSVNGKPLHPYFDVFEEGYEQAEKENAELKERLELLNLNANIAVRDLNDLLTKAEEVIKDLLNLPFANNEEVYADVTSHLDRAEQFLKEIEK